MADDVVKRAVVEVSARTEEFRRDMEALDREHERTMRDIGRRKAEVEVEFDTARLRDSKKKVEREIRDIDGQIATLDVEVDESSVKKLRAQKKELQREWKGLDGQLARLEIEVVGEQEARRAHARIEAMKDRGDKAAEKRTQAQERRLARELTVAERQARAIDAERTRIPKLQATYVKLQRQLEKVAEAKRKAMKDDDVSFKVELEANERALLAELEGIKRTIQTVTGRDPIDIPVRLEPGAGFANNLKGAIARARREGTSAAAAAGVAIGVTMGNAAGRSFARTFSGANLLNTVGAGFRNVLNKVGGLADMTVRLGPFTATVRQATFALSAFAPMILDVLGALGSLVSVTGSAAAGLGALGAAVAGGGIPAMLGFGLVIKGVTEQYGYVQKATEAYDKAVREHGKHSDEAAKKEKILKHVLGAVSEETVEAFKSMQALGRSWREATEPARAKVFETMGKGITTAEKMMDRFAQRTNEGMGTLARGVQGWLDRLSSPKGVSTLDTMMANFNRALGPALHGLGNFVAYLGKIGASASRYLPGIARTFRDWSGALNTAANDTDTLNAKIDKQQQSLRAVGSFLMAGARLMKAFFAPGVEEGQSFLSTMTAAMQRWTDFLNTTEGQNKMRDFFAEAVKGAQTLWKNLAPLVTTFTQWAITIAPIARLFGEITGAITGFVTGLLKLVGLQNSVTGLITTLGVLWGVGKIKKATDAIAGFSRALLGIGPAATTAATTANVGDAIGAGMNSGKSQASMGSRMKGLFVSGLKKAGLIGVGLMALDAIGAGMQTAQAREGLESTIVGVSRDISNTLTFGLVNGAKESSKKAYKAAADALRANPNLNLKADIQLGGGGLNKFGTQDLTKDMRQKLETGFKAALQRVDELSRQHQLPSFKGAVKIDANPQDIITLERNWGRMKNNLTSTLTAVRNTSAQSMRAIAQTMDMRSQEGKNAVQQNFRLTADAITNNIKNGRVSASTGMREIREQFRTHSQAAKGTTQANFAAARAAIEDAASRSLITSKEKLAALAKLWEENLQMYGFSPKQARNIRKTGDPDANKGREGGAVRAGANARGGLYNIGRPGQAGQDSVPMNLGGVPSIVAPGEQIAVFNRHQQKAMRGAVPGGLEGFFSGHQRPHYAAAGGIVPVPGFPGERANSSILGRIADVTSKFGLRLTDAYGQGHKSPGHTQFGTAADFAGPDKNMDAAVKALVAAGYLVGYDGRFGSKAWPGHGPTSVAGGNAHLHVEFGSKGGGIAGGLSGGIEAPKIKRQIAEQGLGLMTQVSQAMLDTARGAAQANLDAVAAQSIAVPVGGGGDGQGAGPGAASREQMVRWARAGLQRSGVFPPTPENIEKILALAMKESSWNPRSMNNWDSNAKAGNPSGGLMHITIDKVGGSLMRLHDPVENIAVSARYQKSRYGTLVTHSPYARGGMVGFDTMPMARGGRIDQPTLMTGETAREYVINTQRKDNLPFLKAAAREMGLPMADSGMAPHPTGRAYSGVADSRSKIKTRKGYYAEGAGGDVGDLPEVKAYEDTKDLEDAQNRRISIAESQIQEPDTFIQEVGKDPKTGEPVYAVDQTKVQAYQQQLGTVLAEHRKLLLIIKMMIARYQELVVAINNYVRDRFTNIGVLKQVRQNNIDVLQTPLPKAGKTKASKERREKAERQREAARERLRDVNARIDDQEGKVDTAREYRDDTLKKERQDIGFRSQEYAVAREDLQRRLNEVPGRAAAEAAGANPKPPAPDDTPVAESPNVEGQRDAALKRASDAESRLRVSEASVRAFGSTGDIGMGGYTHAFQAANDPSNAYGGASAARQAIGSGARITSFMSASGGFTGNRPATSDIVAAGASGVGQAVTININTLSGADPRVASALAETVTAGFSSQGYRSASRVPAGI